MKNNAFTLVQAIFVIAVLAVAAAVLFPVFGRSPGGCEYRTSCSSNLKQIGLGIMQYTQDYDEKFPLVLSGRSGWSETLQPYVKSKWIFQCPNEKTPIVADEFTNDYFYNARLAKVSFNSVAAPDKTIMNGDGNASSPTNAHLRQFPADWLSNPNSPARRHRFGAPYSFADGHVKSMKPEEFAKNYTFAIK